MPPHVKAWVALAGGAVVVTLAGGLFSNVTPAPIAAPTSSVAPTPPSPVAPINQDRDGAIGNNPPNCVEPYCGVLLNPPPR